MSGSERGGTPPRAGVQDAEEHRPSSPPGEPRSEQKAGVAAKAPQEGGEGEGGDGGASDRKRSDRKRERKLRRKSRSRSRSRSREGKSKDKRSRRSRSSDRRRRSRSRSRSLSRDRSRSRSRVRSRRHRSSKRRSRSPQSRSRSRSRGRRDRSRSRGRRRDDSYRHRSSSRGRRGRGRYSDHSSDGGYRPRGGRGRDEPPRPAAGQAPPSANDPWAHLRNPSIMSDPAEMARIWQEQMLKSRQLIIQQQAKSAAQAAAKSQRELYIGNLAAGMVTADALRQVFDSALMAAYPESALPGAAPVVNCNVHKDGKYGFVEFRTPEYATAALQLNGSVHLMGTTISIGRPAAYIDPNKVAVAAQQAELQIAMQRAGIAPGAAASAVIGALPPPPLIPGVLPPPPVLPGVAPPAPPPGGPPPPGAAAVSVPGVAAAAGNLGYNLASEPGYSVLPTRFVAVAGMVTAEVLADNDEYEDVVEDLRDECRRHGRVAGIKVPRPANPADSASLMYSGPYGKAYVEFEGPEGAQAAKDAIHGRVFAGNLVQAVFITPEAFEVVPSK